MCCIHATFALFYCLLFNLNLNSYGFEFKFNVFEPFQKWKSLFFPSPFQPLRPISSFSFLLFSSFPRPRKPSRAGPKLSPARPSRHPLSRTGRQAGPARRARPLPPAQAGLQLRESRPRTPRRGCLGPHAEASSPPYLSAARPPLNPSSKPPLPLARGSVRV